MTPETQSVSGKIEPERKGQHIQMGLSISYPPDDYLPAVDDNMGRLFIRSLSFDDAMMEADEAATAESPSSSSALLPAAESPSPSALLPAAAAPGRGGSSKLLAEGSLSFKARSSEPDDNLQQTETTLSKPERETEGGNNGSSSFVVNPTPSSAVPSSAAIGMYSARHQAAALRLQKVYKSFRTRRQLADCAVLVEQRWWKLLDFAELKRNSVSFFEIEKPETVVSKWSRATIKAAKVGKGLSKDEKAQKLALQHWLEAIDPRHRYGHNLHYYYHLWLHCQSKQPFFYWLDVGEGKDVSLDEHCSRSKMHKQCIKYLGPKEREAYEVIVEDARFMYKLTRQVLDTTGSDKGIKWIFVLSTSKNLYIGQKKKGVFQHSSFLAGGATSAAGRLVVEDGILKAVWPHSGHYRPTEQNFQEFMNFLKERSVDLTNVKLSSLEGEEDSNFSLEGGQSQLDLAELCELADEQEAQKATQDHDEGGIKTSNGAATVSSTETETSAQTTISKVPSANKLHWKRPPRLQINSNNRIPMPPSTHGPATKDMASDSDMFSECLDFCKRNLFLEDGYEEDLVEVPEELIMDRINSKRSLMSYQLGKQLSFQWSTGAGPRIGCVRDYPSELQFMALEKVSLSPRGSKVMRFTSPRPSALTPNSIDTTQGDNMNIPLKPRKRSVTWDAF